MNGTCEIKTTDLMANAPSELTPNKKTTKKKPKPSKPSFCCQQAGARQQEHERKIASDRPTLLLTLLTSQMAPMGSNLMVMSLPNRDELSLRTVLAFPKASRMGLACAWMRR